MFGAAWPFSRRKHSRLLYDPLASDSQPAVDADVFASRQHRSNWPASALLSCFFGGLLTASILFPLVQHPLSATKTVLQPPVHPILLHFQSNAEKNTSPALLPSVCPIPVIFTTDAHAADAVIYDADRFFSMDNRTRLRETRPWQVQVITGLEAAPQRRTLQNHYRAVKEGRRNETYDLEMTYRLDSAVPRLYAYEWYNYTTPPVSWANKRQDKLASVFQSNCW